MESIVAPTSAYKIRIRTDSADSNGCLLLESGELIAILMELADESHGDERGQWVIETVFGLNQGRRPRTFACAADAAEWIGEHVCHQPFLLEQHLVMLS